MWNRLIIILEVNSRNCSGPWAAQSNMACTMACCRERIKHPLICARRLVTNKEKYRLPVFIVSGFLRLYSWPGEFLEFHCHRRPHRQKCNKAILWEYKYARIMYREIPHYVTAACIVRRRTKPQAAVCEKIGVTAGNLSIIPCSRLCANSLSTRGSVDGWGWENIRLLLLRY